MDFRNRQSHPVRPDYFYGTAGELWEGDGFRLIAPSADLDRPLVAARVDAFEGLVSISLIDRSSMVNEALGNLPSGVAEVVETIVLNESDQVLIRY